MVCDNLTTCKGIGNINISLKNHYITKNCPLNENGKDRCCFGTSVEDSEREENGEIDEEDKTEGEDSWEEDDEMDKEDKSEEEDDTEGKDGTGDKSGKYFCKKIKGKKIFCANNSKINLRK